MTNAFHYQTFRRDTDGTTVHFDYTIDQAGQTYDLTESITFPVRLLDTPAQAASLRALHIALGISYYKIFVPPIMTHPYALDESEASFWNEIWTHGLGEFLYVNQLSAAQLARFMPQDGVEIPAGQGPASTLPNTPSALLGIGGGKDSIVAGELLKDLAMPLKGFVMATGEQRGQAQAVATTMDIPLHVVERRLDSQLLQLQTGPGAYKGHVPISLIFGLVGTVLAVATDTTYVVVANEASASIPRVEWQGQAVNHQWSKSFDFEQDLQSYIHHRISPVQTYFSAIRQLTSVGVAKVFARYPAYFKVFTSDNFVFRIDPAKRPNSRWSLESPKSLSSFILLAPWIDQAVLIDMFGRDFLNEPSLSDLFNELTGLQGHPPLDCVGTVEELVLSLNVAYRQGKFSTSHLMLAAEATGLLQINDPEPLAEMLRLQTDQALPDELIGRVDHHLQELLSA